MNAFSVDDGLRNAEKGEEARDVFGIINNGMHAAGGDGAHGGTKTRAKIIRMP